MMPIAPNPKTPTPGQRLVIAEHQEGVRPLPAWWLEEEGTVLTRWHLSDDERAALAGGADIWIGVRTFGRPLQPLLVGTRGSDIARGWPDD